jgi:simple sugar transport system ATP-binding protein
MLRETADQVSGGPLLQLSGIVKRFPGTLANDHVDLSIVPGEIHALLGENGAGKSTLVKIIYGVLQPDAGEIRWQGRPVAITSPKHARSLGIGMVFQHFSLFEGLTVFENVALGIGDKTLRRGLRARMTAIADAYGLPLDPDRDLHDLSAGERQRVEIVRSLLQSPRLLVMDEPTSVLTPQEVERLFETLRRLRAEGCAILYISHKLEEIRALCDRATVMRQGRVVAECVPANESAHRLAELMIGTEIAPPRRSTRRSGAAGRLVVDRLTLAADNPFGVALHDVSFDVAGGEILGIAGIAGNGQTELMDALSGERLAGRADAIMLDGKPVGDLLPAERRALGAAFVPEERNGHAAVPGMTLAENAFLSAYVRRALTRIGLIDRGRTRAFAAGVIGRFDVRTTGPEAEAGSLSGGNLQKFVVGREMEQEPAVLVLAQPTWGVDAGAAAAIHAALAALAADGAAVLVISQDLDEIFALCDRIAVIAGGRLSPPRPRADTTVAEIGILMGAAHGRSDAPAEAGRVDAA